MFVRVKEPTIYVYVESIENKWRSDTLPCCLQNCCQEGFMIRTIKGRLGSTWMFKWKSPPLMSVFMYGKEVEVKWRYVLMYGHGALTAAAWSDWQLGQQQSRLGSTWMFFQRKEPTSLCVRQSGQIQVKVRSTAILLQQLLPGEIDNQDNNEATFIIK